MQFLFKMDDERKQKRIQQFNTYVERLILDHNITTVSKAWYLYTKALDSRDREAFWECYVEMRNKVVH